MIDTAALKSQIDLLTLAEGHTSLRRVAASEGGEWAGPCPFCGGQDRFRVQPQAGGGGRWLCRGCSDGKWQDALEFGKRLWPELSFVQVCERLAERVGGTAHSLRLSRRHTASVAHIETPGPVRPAYAPPPDAWQAAARQAMAACGQALWGGAGQPALAYLRRRGLQDETIRYWRLGWSDGLKIPLTPSPSPRGGGESVSPPPLGEGSGVRERSGEPSKSPLSPALLARCRELRQNATQAEVLLWLLLRNNQLLGAKFRRQHPHKGYILDFYCHEARLAVELDGSGHLEDDQSRHDDMRTRAFQDDGIRVLRFWNHQALNETQAVLEEIAFALETSLTPGPSPEGGGGKDSPPPSGEGPGVRETTLWIPRGILIPCAALGQVWYLKIALLPGDPVKCQGCSQSTPARQPCPQCGTLNKYRGVKGNRPAAIFGADDLPGAPLALFVEGEFDAMMAWQELRDVAAVCTLGSAGTRLDLATWGAVLLPLERIYAAYDADEAGQKGAAALQDFSERVTACALPPGVKDINDYVLKGGKLWPWLKTLLEGG